LTLFQLDKKRKNPTRPVDSNSSRQIANTENYNLLKINKFNIIMVFMPPLQKLLPDIGSELAMLMNVK